MSLPRPMTGPVASRRTALAGGLVGLLVTAGCDDDPGSAPPGSVRTTAAPEDADSRLVEKVLDQIMGAWTVVLRARGARPGLRTQTRSLDDLHAAHWSALEGPRRTNLPEDPAGPPPDLPRIRAAETRLQRQLTEAAVRAESGALATLLASMAAGVAQHLAVLS